jgi:hypothetical protein
LSPVTVIFRFFIHFAFKRLGDPFAHFNVFVDPMSEFVAFLNQLVTLVCCELGLAGLNCNGEGKRRRLVSTCNKRTHSGTVLHRGT